MSSKVNLAIQAEKLQSLMGSARLKTTGAQTEADARQGGASDALASPVPVNADLKKAKNLRAVPVTYFDAHARLKSSSKTSLDFSAYILEAIREKLERDGAL